MVIGEDPQALFRQLQSQMPQGAGIQLPKPSIGGSVAAAILPGAVVGLVDRHRHPIVWWVFGIIPLAWSGSRLVLALTDKK
jgi:hypothetical protein